MAITADQARKAAGRRWRAFPAVPIDSSGVSAEDGLDLHQALAVLSRRQRQAVDCFYFVGLSLAQTAAVMGCSDGTVKSTLADARAKLRTVLEVSE